MQLTPPSVPSASYASYAGSGANINTKGVSESSKTLINSKVMDTRNEEEIYFDYKKTNETLTPPSPPGLESKKVKTEHIEVMSPLSFEQKSKLESGIGIETKFGDKSITLIPKLTQEQISNLEQGISVSFAHEDGKKYTLSELPSKKEPPKQASNLPPADEQVGDMLKDAFMTITADDGTTKQAIYPMYDLAKENINMAKEAIMDKAHKYELPEKMRDFKMVVENLYKNDNTYAKIVNGEPVFRGFRI